VFSASAIDGGLSAPNDIVLDAGNGYFYLTDSTNNRVSKFNLSNGSFVGSIGNSTATGTCVAGKQTAWCTGGTFSSSTTAGAFNAPTGLALDGSGFLYIADNGNYRFAKYSTAGAFVGHVGIANAANGNCVSGKQSTWCTGSPTFYNGTTSTDGNFSGAFRIAIDSTNGFIYVGQGFRLQKLTLSTGAAIGSIGDSQSTTGTCVIGVQTTWCTGGFNFSSWVADSGFSGSLAVDLDSSQNIYVVDTGSSRIQEYLNTGVFVKATGSFEVASPGWSPGVMSTASGASDGVFAQTSYTNTIRIDKVNGYIYVADTQNSRIQKFNLKTGAFVGAIGNTVASTGTCASSGAQTGWCTGGFFFSGTGDGMFSSPQGLALDITGGALLVTDYFNSRVQKFNLSTGAFIGAIGYSTASGTCVAGKQTAWCTGGTFSANTVDGSFYNPTAITIDSVGGYFYVGGLNQNNIYRFTLSSGAFAGGVGQTTSSSGTCTAGSNVIQSTWCTGGVYKTNVINGSYGGILDMVLDHSAGFLYAIDKGFIFPNTYTRLIKVNLTTGAFVGAIGDSTAATGTCVIGKQSGWCVPAASATNFTTNIGDGYFYIFHALAIDTTNGYIYSSSAWGQNVSKYTTAGAFVGSIGYVNSTTGTCIAGKPTGTWCTGGSFSYVTQNQKGTFVNPTGLDIDPTTGYLYIMDLFRMQKIRRR
jgi:DNA-binding beta-propeller fold protein YncE